MAAGTAAAGVAALGRLPAPQLLFNYLGRWSAGDADWQPAPEPLRTDPDPDLGTPYLLEVNAACDDTADGCTGGNCTCGGGPECFIMCAPFIGCFPA